jgi:hypothetical protein
MTTGSIELASARVSARYGRRVDVVQWHRIEAPRTLAGVLDAVRTTPLDGWVSGLTPSSDAHAIDRRMRAGWREVVHEVARWMPERWQPAVAWWATLPDLPLAAALASGAEVPRWLRQDPHYRALLEPAHARAHPLTALRASGTDMGAAWLAEWNRRAPRDASGWVDRLVALVAEHLRTFRALAPGDGTHARRTLQPRVVMLMRHAPATPAAVLAYLVLALGEGERLRGELMRRAAFPAIALAP